MSRSSDRESPPIGFVAFVVLAGLYLLLRLVQGIAWVVQHLG